LTKLSATQSGSIWLCFSYRRKTKKKINVEKTIFYNFDALNAHITRKISFLISLTSVLGALFSIFLNLINLLIFNLLSHNK
jgi:hypothetical protein